MTELTSTQQANAMTLSEVARYLRVFGNSKADVIHRVHFVTQSSFFRGTDIAQAVYTLEWARSTGRFSGEVEMAIRKLSPYQVLKLCFSARAGTMAECYDNLKALLTPAVVEVKPALTALQTWTLKRAETLDDYTGKGRPLYVVGYSINKSYHYEVGFVAADVERVKRNLSAYGYPTAVVFQGQVLE